MLRIFYLRLKSVTFLHKLIEDPFDIDFEDLFFWNWLEKNMPLFFVGHFWKSQFLKKYSNDICVDSKEFLSRDWISNFILSKFLAYTSVPILNGKFDWTRCNFLSGKCLPDKSLGIFAWNTRFGNFFGKWKKNQKIQNRKYDITSKVANEVSNFWKLFQLPRARYVSNSIEIQTKNSQKIFY